MQTKHGGRRSLDSARKLEEQQLSEAGASESQPMPTAEDEKAAAWRAHEAERLKRKVFPESDTELDATVRRLITERQYTSQDHLRADVGCTVPRLRAALARLTYAGCIERGPETYPPRPRAWRSLP